MTWWRRLFRWWREVTVEQTLMSDDWMKEHIYRTGAARSDEHLTD